MPSIVYHRCKKIIELCKEEGYWKTISLDDLRQLIAENIGGDPRTLKLYLSRLQYFGLMKRMNPKVFQILPKTVNKKAVREQQEKIDDAILRVYGIKE